MSHETGTTARQAYERGYRVVFGSDVTATDDESRQEPELAVLRKGFALVLTADEIAGGWTSADRAPRIPAPAAHAWLRTVRRRTSGLAFAPVTMPLLRAQGQHARCHPPRPRPGRWSARAMSARNRLARLSYGQVPCPLRCRLHRRGEMRLS